MNRTDINEASGILSQVTAELMKFTTTDQAAVHTMKQLVGWLIADVEGYATDGTIGTDMYEAFEAARAAGAKFETFEALATMLIGVTPQSNMARLVVAAGLTFSTVELCQLVAGMTFSSRDDVADIMVRIGGIFEQIKVTISDLLDGENYQAIVQMAATTNQHLALTELKLPKVVVKTFATSIPGPALAQRIYGDASKWEEIMDENKVVHPAFPPLTVTVLSDA